MKAKMLLLSILTIIGIGLSSCKTGSGGGNTPPLAHAGADQNVHTASIVILDGSLSIDVDLDTLTYTWRFISKPVDSNATLSDTTTVNPIFTADVDGVYVLQLVVNDGTVDSVADLVAVNAFTGNAAPIADAGIDQNVNTASLVALDGSESSDIDLDPLTYSWSMVSRPVGSTAELSDPLVVNPTFIADVDGVYVMELVVNDGTVDSLVDIVTVTATTGNAAPVANAGGDQNVVTPSVVALDGSGSTDADGDLLTYTWSMVSRPVGSTAALSSPTVVNPTFTADVDGAYVMMLIVNDGTVDSAADTIVVTATTINAAPVANAGGDQNVVTTSVVALDGSGSTDADPGDTLTYAWTMVSKPLGSVAVLSSIAIVNPTFTADLDGAYVMQLIVNDGTVDSAVDTITVNATTTNATPMADAGADQDVITGASVTLNGGGSTDADGDPITYAWTMVSRPAGSGAALVNPTSVVPTFTTDVDGAYVIQLVVNDGTVSSVSSHITVNAIAANLPPVANAGTDQNVVTGTDVTLNGSLSSDANGDPLTYLWTVVSTPAGSALATGTTVAVVNPTFTADVDGAYVMQLIVNDGTVDSLADIVTVNAATANSAPVANAGVAQNVLTGAVVTLNGSLSSDADLDPLTYAWSIVSAPATSTAVLSDPTSVVPTFTADLDGAYVMQLIVKDGTLFSAPDIVVVNAAAGNVAPVANAGVNQNVLTGTVVTVDGSGSTDANGDPLTYAWSMVSAPVGSALTGASDTGVSPTFAPDLDGAYVLQLIVNDGTVDSAADIVVINAAAGNVAPVANAGADQYIEYANIDMTEVVAILDGSGSYDDDGDPLTYAWTVIGGPEGSPLIGTMLTGVSPILIVPIEDMYFLANYTVKLIVNDGTVDSLTDYVTVYAYPEGTFLP